jgi:hypothetical protein
MLAIIQSRTFCFLVHCLKIKIRIYKTVVLYVYGTWSLTLREEHRLRTFENRVLRRIFGLGGIKWWEVGENCEMRNFLTCTLWQGG